MGRSEVCGRGGGVVVGASCVKRVGRSEVCGRGGGVVVRASCVV